MNLKRDFETLTMKEKDTVREYNDKLMSVVNKIRLMGEDLPDNKVVEKLFDSLPERFKAKLSSFEDSKDASELALSELINSLQAQEQSKAMRYKETEHVVETEHAIEEAFLAKKSKKMWSLHEEKDYWNNGNLNVLIARG